MNCRNFFVAQVLILLILAPVHAEGSDAVQKSHFYMESGGALAFPLGFYSTEFVRHDLMDYGASFNAGAGLNFGGWLLGVEVTRDMWWSSTDENNLLVRYNDNMLLLRIQKVISKSSWHFLPAWLELVPGIGAGVNFVNAEFYTSTRAKSEGLSTTMRVPDMNGFSLAVRASLGISLWFGSDWVIPYLGADLTVLPDSLSDLSVIAVPRAYAGLRIYPGSIVRSAREKKLRRYRETVGTWGPAIAELEVQPQSGFVPSAAKDGTLEINTAYEYLEHRPERWTVEILGADGKPCASWEGTGSPPKRIRWDGTLADGSQVLSLQTYTVRLILIPQAEDRDRNGQQMIGTQTAVRTGLVLHEEQDADGTLRRRALVGGIQLGGEPTRAQEQATGEAFDVLAQAAAGCTVTVYARTQELALLAKEQLVMRGIPQESVLAQEKDLLLPQLEVVLEQEETWNVF